VTTFLLPSKRQKAANLTLHKPWPVGLYYIHLFR